MKDPHIRHLLRQTELLQHINDPLTKVVEELKLPVAKARIDMAVINGHLHGYEIKSASDTLNRLPSQLMAYEKIFDYVTVVTEEKYHSKLINILPEWVGITVCIDEHTIEEKRKPTYNNKKIGFYIAKLLWRDEIISALEQHNVKHYKADRTWTLCETLSENLGIEKLSDIVRAKLKVRQNWKEYSITHEEV